MARAKKQDLLDLDQICAWLEAGDNMTTIAKRYKVDRATLNRFLSQPHNSARANEARAAAAAAFADMAEEIIKNSRGALSFQKARELAHHYRWKASKANPKQFGDKIQADVDMSLQVTKVTCTIIDSADE